MKDKRHAREIQRQRKKYYMSIKALFFDIDGTILNSQGVMNKAVFETLLECKRKGFLISIVTARSGRIVFRDHEIPGVKNQLLERGIFYNGGTIFDNIHGFYQHTPVPGNIISELTSFVQKYDDNLQIALQHDDIYHSFKFKMSDKELISWGFRAEEIIDFKKAQIEPTTKMMVFVGQEWQRISGDLSDLHSEMSRHFGAIVNFILADSKKSIYILSKYATKGNAINKLISLYGIPPNEVAVFGDDTPDIGMFGMFGESIAMGNAHDSLKAISTFVTKSNDEDGVIYALKNHLKIL